MRIFKFTIEELMSTSKRVSLFISLYIYDSLLLARAPRNHEENGNDDETEVKEVFFE